jgi:hypothetical protein
MITLPYFQKSILIGILLSPPLSISFKTSDLNMYFNIFLITFFKNRDNKKYFYRSIEFYTRALPCFTEYQNLFYKNKVIFIIY